MADTKAKKSNGRLCSILCTDKKFHLFLQLWIEDLLGPGIFINDNNQCEFMVKWVFEIESRSELNEGGLSKLWLKMQSDYYTFRKYARD